MAEPAEVPKKRRRWRWIALALLMLLVGGPIAWRFRPLNEHERQVLGKYEVQFSPQIRTGEVPKWVLENLALSADRRYVHNFFGRNPRYEEHGSWEAERDVVILIPDLQPSTGTRWHSHVRRYVDWMLTPRRRVFRREGDELCEGQHDDFRFRRVHTADP